MKIIIGLVILISISIFLVIFNHFISDYDKCYNAQEDSGNAVFGECGGLSGGSKNTESEMCCSCPHYYKRLEVNKNEEDNLF